MVLWFSSLPESLQHALLLPRSARARDSELELEPKFQHDERDTDQQHQALLLREGAQPQLDIVVRVVPDTPEHGSEDRLPEREHKRGL